MAKGNIQPALKDVLVHEGGYWTGGKRGAGVLKGAKKGHLDCSLSAPRHLGAERQSDRRNL